MFVDWDIERTLSYLFGPVKAKKCGRTPRNFLLKILALPFPTRKSEPYALRDEPVKPEQEVLQDFFDEKRSKVKIALAEKLFDLATEKEDLQGDLPQVLRAHFCDTGSEKPQSGRPSLWDLGQEQLAPRR